MRSDLWQEEFYDVIRILEHGAEKYGANTWLAEDVNLAHFNHEKNHNSMFHHLAESYNQYLADEESGEHPLLHLACRALMEYTRVKRGLEI